MRHLALGDVRNVHGRRAADGLGQQAQRVVEVRRRPQSAVPPGRVRRSAAHRHAGHAVGRKASVHRRAEQVDAEGNQRVEDEVERVAERRSEHHRAGGGGLMVVVDDLGKPLAVQDAIHVDRLGLRGHVEVAVVVVTRVLLIQTRQVRRHALRRVGLAHVPVGRQFLAVRIGVHEQHDHVAQDAQRLGVVATDELIRGLDELLRSEDLARVQTAVDPDDRLSLGGQRAGLGVREVFGARQPPRDLLEAIERATVVGRRDDGHPLRAALLGSARCRRATCDPIRGRASSSRLRSGYSWRGNSRRRCSRQTALSDDVIPGATCDCVLAQWAIDTTSATLTSPPASFGSPSRAT